MNFQNVAIESLEYALGPNVWTSGDIEKQLAPLYQRLKLPEGRLELMTGIRERCFWERETLASEASSHAGRSLLAKTRIQKENIDLLIHSAVSRDRLEPATASYVHRHLELTGRTQILDISNACLGFLNAMVLAGGLIENRQIESALIVSGENGRPLVERTIEILLGKEMDRKTIKPYFANLTIGAGAVGAMLCHRDLLDERSTPLMCSAIVETDTSHNHLCEGDSTGSDGLEMQTDSEELLNAGISVAERAWKKFEEETGWTTATPQHFITHQVGRAHQRRLYEALGIDEAKDFSTFPELGNVGSVSLPITLAKAVESGRIQSGEKAALLGIGSGLSSIMMAIEW